MKKCPRCGQVYTEDELNFCLNDGELLGLLTGAQAGPSGGRGYADDSPPTLVMDSSRVTNQSWQNASPPVPWQSQSPAAQNQAFGLASSQQSQNQTLPTVSLVLGIISCFTVCCAGGVIFGIPAAICGYLGMRNADSEPNRYTGRGLAVAGMVIGIVTFLLSIVFLLFGAMN